MWKGYSLSLSNGKAVSPLNILNACPRQAANQTWQIDKPGVLAIQSPTWQRQDQQWLVTSSIPSFLAPCLQVLTAICKEKPHILRYSFSCSFMFCAWLAWCCTMRLFHNKSIFSFVLSKVGDDWCFSQSWTVFTMHKNVAQHSVSVFL